MACGLLITYEEGGYFCRETARRPSTMVSFRMPRIKVKAAAAAAISLGHAACGWPPLLWMGVHVRHSSDNSCGFSNDKAHAYRLCGACPIVMVAQRPVDWRPANSTRCGCAATVGSPVSYWWETTSLFTFFCFSVFHFLVVGFVRRYREIAPRVNKQMCIEKAVPIQ